MKAVLVLEYEVDEHGKESLTPLFDAMSSIKALPDDRRPLLTHLAIMDVADGILTTLKYA